MVRHATSRRYVDIGDVMHACNVMYMYVDMSHVTRQLFAIARRIGRDGHGLSIDNRHVYYLWSTVYRSVDNNYIIYAISTPSTSYYVYPHTYIDTRYI